MVLIANRTMPSLAVRCAVVREGEKSMLRVEVPKSRHLVGTTDGRYLQRRMKADGSPEAVPMLPHDLTRRQVSLSQLDVTAQPVPGATVNDLDPLERVRLRRIIERQKGDVALLALGDEEFDGALGLALGTPEGSRPTLAGVLLLGKAERLRELVPTQEVAFQVLDGTDVRTNDFFRLPLARVVEEVDSRFDALSAVWGEEEFEDGLFRIAVPRYEKRAFREALLNAIIHRDYTRLGACHIRFDSAGLTISNPGGFVEGVTIENLLTVEPRPRNPHLADVMKRLGLVERTGRGVDRIFEGMLRFGRPEPDYSRTDSSSVVLTLADAKADFAFLRMILIEEARRGNQLPIDSLVVLSRLRTGRRLNQAELQEGALTAQFRSRRTMERLTEAGLVEAHGTGKGRTYTLSAKVYRATGEQAQYVRQAGFDDLQQEQMVLKFVEKHGEIRRAQVMELCRISKDQAAKLLRRLAKAGELRMHGVKRGAYYERAHKL
jgi:ATP-dependent DNA helicase RecG